MSPPERDQPEWVYPTRPLRKNPQWFASLKKPGPKVNLLGSAPAAWYESLKKESPPLNPQAPAPATWYESLKKPGPKVNLRGTAPDRWYESLKDNTPRSPSDVSFAMAHLFEVRFEGGPLTNLGYWNQVSGLSVSWNVLDHRTGDGGNFRWYFPGVTTYSNVTLKRAVCKESMLVKEWLDKTSFDHRPCDGKVSLIDMDKNIHDPIMQWELRRLMPTKWSVDGFDAGQGKVVIETLELVHLGFLDEERAP